LEALLLHREKSNDMVRISSRKWTFAQIEELSALIAAGSSAAKRGYDIEAFNYSRSSEGPKSRDAVSDDRGAPTRFLRPPHQLAASFIVPIEMRWPA
jgi:hypothetical protein